MYVPTYKAEQQTTGKIYRKIEKKQRPQMRDANTLFLFKNKIKKNTSRAAKETEREKLCILKYSMRNISFHFHTGEYLCAYVLPFIVLWDPIYMFHRVISVCIVSVFLRLIVKIYIQWTYGVSHKIVSISSSSSSHQYFSSLLFFRYEEDKKWWGD